MASITTRNGKGSALTHVELDNNFTNLNNDKLEVATASSTYLPLAGGTLTGGLTFAAGQTTATVSSPNIVQLTDSTSSTSTTTAATPKNVKSAFDLATAALPKAGGSLTGVVDLNVTHTSPAFTITQSGSGVGLKVTQAGTGDAFLVEDQAADTTPFVIKDDGKVGIGLASPTEVLHVVGKIRTVSASAEDGIILEGRGAGSNSRTVTIKPAALGANRTLTLADGDTTLQGGTMAITGGTLAQFASTTSSQLAGVVSDETGSGALVFATSPTLVTPVLGTPSSGTLSSCSGLPVSTGISGLGAGVATFLATPSSSNLLAAVTNETGSGALVFATSPTLATPNIGAATGTSLSLSGGSLTARPAATQDAVIVAGRAGGSSSYAVSITPTTLTASRTLTLADGNTTLTAGTMATIDEATALAIALG